MIYNGHSLYQLGIIVDICEVVTGSVLCNTYCRCYNDAFCLLCLGMHQLQKSTSFLVICFYFASCAICDMVVITVTVELS